MCNKQEIDLFLVSFPITIECRHHIWTPNYISKLSGPVDKLQIFSMCNVCQSELWPWRSEPDAVEEETRLHSIAIYPWTENSHTDIPPDDPFQFEKYIRDQKCPEKKAELLSKALHHQIERTNYIDNTCKQMISDKVISNQIRDMMRDKILELENENDLLRKLLQHLKMTNDLASQRKKEQALYRACLDETYDHSETHAGCRYV